MTAFKIVFWVWFEQIHVNLAKISFWALLSPIKIWQVQYNKLWSLKVWYSYWSAMILAFQCVYFIAKSIRPVWKPISATLLSTIKWSQQEFDKFNMQKKSLNLVLTKRPTWYPVGDLSNLSVSGRPTLIFKLPVDGFLNVQTCLKGCSSNFTRMLNIIFIIFSFKHLNLHANGAQLNGLNEWNI